MHGLFVDDMVHASTSGRLKLDFIAEYKRDFEITCEDLMTYFLGMEVEQDKSSIHLHLATTSKTHCRSIGSNQEVRETKEVPMQPGIVLEHDLCPETPDQREQKVYH